MIRKKNCLLLTTLILLSAVLAGCGSTAVQPEESTVPAETALEDFKNAGDKTDIAALQQINPEAYAWLEITGTDISFPILQSAEDETFYLTHNIYGEEDDNGSIYTEYYNNTDFADPNTVIYGRNRDEMFGKLHQFQDRDFFDTHREIKIYTAGKTLTYKIFAAYTYDDRHLIATYDFWDQLVFSNYLEDVFAIRAMDAFIDDSVEVTAENKIITLSTGVTGQDDKRYLVQAVLVTE
ncbi:class B sortase [Eisenbergiella porci]|uniref:class B sortase n=1 Tax=Eisenbergiella porci TaxID=2652274 RepID=UPI002A839696|nr:class B sortase [Eisenbergiella porci]